MQIKGVNNKSVSFEEMKKFLGIKKLPSYCDYWNSVKEMIDLYILKVMPVNRFGWFLSNLHINDNTKKSW